MTRRLGHQLVSVRMCFVPVEVPSLASESGRALSILWSFFLVMGAREILCVGAAGGITRTQLLAVMSRLMPGTETTPLLPQLLATAL